MTLFDRPVTRRRFLSGAATVAAGAAAAACAPPGTTTTGGGGGKKQLRILQWSHFVPDYDKWLDDFVGNWGQKNKVDVAIDHINTDDLPARMAAEVAAKSGHDLVEMNGQILTYLYDKQLVTMDDVVDYAVKKYGEVEPIGQKLAKVNGRWVGWPNYYIAIQPQIRTDLFSSIGYDWQNGGKPWTWDKLLEVGTKLKAMTDPDKFGQKFGDGRPAGLAISHCNDANHNWRAIMWAFGASEVGPDGKSITVDSQEMRAFLKFAQQFYAQANTPDVFAWDNTSDNRWLTSGQGGYIHDAISSMRSLQGKNDALYNTIKLGGPVGGPAKPNGISMPDANVYVIWNWAPKGNQDTAKEFLRYYIDNYEESFKQSKLYNQPMHANRYNSNIFTDTSSNYSVLQQYRGDKVQTFGYPGPPNYLANLVLANYIIPDMVQTAVKQPGDAGVKAAIDFGVAQMKRQATNAG